jgi:hypothetical protein
VGAIARKLIVEVVGETAGLSRAFHQASRDATSFQGTIEHTFRNVGRNIALGTAALVGVGGITEAFTKSIGAAEDAAVAQKSLAAQMKASGESFQQNKARIDTAELSLAKYGFTSVDSARALTTLERATGNISKAIQIQGIAADVAKAKNKTLSEAALILGKAYDGNTTSLKRLGVELPKGTKGMEALYIVAQKFHGQAAANTTVLDQFHKTIYDTEVIIGTGLLPTVDRLLGRFDTWLNNMNRTGKTQRDVTTAVKDATAMFEKLKDIVVPLAHAFDVFSKAVGGATNAVTDLVLAFAAFKTARIVSGLAGIGSTAGTAAGKVGTLRGSLTRLQTMGTIVVPVVVAETILQSTAYKKGKSWIDRNLGPASALFAGPKDIYKAGSQAFKNVYDYIAQQFGSGGTQGGGGFAGFSGLGKWIPAAGGLTPNPRFNIPGRAAGFGNETPSGETALSVALALNPNNMKLLQQQAAYDNRQIAFLKTLQRQGRITNKQWHDETLAYANDLVSTMSTINSINAAAAAATKSAADKAKAAAARAKAAAARLLARNQREGEGIAQVFLQGVDTSKIGIHLPAGYAEPMGLQLALARAQAFGSPETLSGRERPILIKMRQAALKALKSGLYLGNAQLQLLNEITNINSQLGGQAKGFSNDIAQAKPYSLTRAGGVVINGGLHLHGVQDFAKLENELEARAKARPKVRRGAR